MTIDAVTAAQNTGYFKDWMRKGINEIQNKEEEIIKKIFEEEMKKVQPIVNVSIKIENYPKMFHSRKDYEEYRERGNLIDIYS